MAQNPLPKALEPLMFAACSFHACRYEFLDEAEFNRAIRSGLEPLVFDYMKSTYGNTLQAFWDSYTIPKESDKALVLVERRCHPHILFCLQNAVYFARGYSVHIVCSIANVKYIRYLLGNHVPNVHIHIQFEGIGSPAQGYAEYNQLLKQLSFWETFTEEHLLMIETDAYFLRPIPEELYQFDYVASAWPWKPDEPGGGGLSYRKRSVMIDICKTVPPGDEPQDIYVSDAVKALGYSYPKDQVFFTEAGYKYDAIGTHQWWTFLSIPTDTTGRSILNAILHYSQLHI
jgi:hypothetical protein